MTITRKLASHYAEKINNISGISAYVGLRIGGTRTNRVYVDIDTDCQPITLTVNFLDTGAKIGDTTLPPPCATLANIVAQPIPYADPSFEEKLIEAINSVAQEYTKLINRP